MKSLQTERTFIRPFKIEDLPELYLIMSDPEVMKHTGFKVVQPKEEVDKLILFWMQDSDEELGVSCVETKDKEFVGWFMIKKVSDYPELGFMVKRDFWNKGYATEVSKELIRHSFEDLNIDKIIAKTNLENSPSINTLKKLGMVEIPSTSESSRLFELISYT